MVEQRTYIKISVLRGRNARECHSELVEAVGNNALPYRTVAILGRRVSERTRNNKRVPGTLRATSQCAE